MRRATFLVFLMFSLQASSQNPDWIWAVSGQGAGPDFGNAIAIDANGNCFSSGTFDTPSVIFGSDTLVSFMGMGEDYYLVKYDNAGNELWATTTIGGGPFGTRVVTDNGGNCYVAGRLGSVIYSGDTVSDHVLLAKYDGSGNVLWVKTAIGAIPDHDVYEKGLSLSSDKKSNIYVAGTCSSNNPPNDYMMIFDYDTLTLEFPCNNVFLAKYDFSGNFKWANSAGGGGISDYCTGICTDKNGNSYITGHFNSDTLFFDGIEVYNNTGGKIFFVAKYDSSGNVIWARSCGKYASFKNPGIGLDADGNCYIGGSFQTSNYVGFDNIQYSANGCSFFLVKHDVAGNLVWAKIADSPYLCELNGIQTDDAGNCYLTGFFNNMIIFGSTLLVSTGFNDVFVAKYDSTGTALGGQKAGGMDEGDYGSALATDAMGNSYITGNFWSSHAYFGNITLINCDTIHTPAEAFIAKLGAITGIEEAGINADQEISIIPNPSGGNFQIIDNANLMEEVSIFNSYGDLILQVEVKDKVMQIDLNVPGGIYFVQVRTEIGIAGKEIIIMK
jgi:hypothetical protein